MKGLLIRRGAGIRSRSGLASAEQQRRMSAMAAKKRILEAVNAESLERVGAHFQSGRTIVKLVLHKNVTCADAKRLVVRFRHKKAALSAPRDYP